MRSSAELQRAGFSGHRDVERVRVLEDARIALRDTHADYEEGARRDVPSLEVEILGRETGR